MGRRLSCRCWIFAVLVLGLPVFADPAPPVDLEEDYDRNHQRMFPRGGGDEFPKVLDPAMATAAEGDRLLKPEDWVVGVSIADEHQAFPVSFLGWPEAVNIRCGGEPIVVTWCVNCQSAIVFHRTVRERMSAFYVEGVQWHNGLCLYDEESGSIWSQVLGLAIKGPLKGTTLDMVPSSLTTWKRWKARHPGTTVYPGARGRNARRGRIEIESRPGDYGFGLATPDAFLAQGGNGTATFYPYEILLLRRVISDVFDGLSIVVVLDPEVGGAQAWSAEADGQALKFYPDPGAGGDGPLRMIDDTSASVWSAADGLCLEGAMQGTRLEAVRAFTWSRSGWREFFPDAAIFKESGGGETGYK